MKKEIDIESEVFIRSSLISSTCLFEQFNRGLLKCNTASIATGPLQLMKFCHEDIQSSVPTSDWLR